MLRGRVVHQLVGRPASRETFGADAGAISRHYGSDPDGHLLAEHDAATGAVVKEYVWINDLPVAVIDSSGGSPVTLFIHAGQLNEPLAMTDAAKATVWNVRYEPFGRAQVFGTASAALDLRLPGQWLQDETGGLHQNGFRDYGPSLGRYVETDPLGIEAGQNVYAYVDGDVLNAIDPDGEFAWIAAGGVIGAGINVGATYIASGGKATARQYAAAAAGGFVAGALGAAAGPLGGTLAMSLGYGSTGTAAVISAAVLSGGANAAGQYIANCIDPENAVNPANAALWGALGGGLVKKFVPTKNLNSWKQARHFGPKTLPGLFGSSNAGRNLGGFAGSSGVGSAANFSAAQPF